MVFCMLIIFFLVSFVKASTVDLFLIDKTILLKKLQNPTSVEYLKFFEGLSILNEELEIKFQFLGSYLINRDEGPEHGNLVVKNCDNGQICFNTKMVRCTIPIDKFKVSKSSPFFEMDSKNCRVLGLYNIKEIRFRTLIVYNKEKMEFHVLDDLSRIKKN